MITKTLKAVASLLFELGLLQVGTLQLGNKSGVTFFFPVVFYLGSLPATTPVPQVGQLFSGPIGIRAWRGRKEKGSKKIVTCLILPWSRWYFHPGGHFWESFRKCTLITRRLYPAVLLMGSNVFLICLVLCFSLGPRNLCWSLFVPPDFPLRKDPE